ncbi:MAG: glycoside hydrolase family 3 C-terminal domain-containing protein [Pseudomonadaceae bacterium]|nr:glycoside hydrolase family 3 C-terminal domain-containing protein [Pseudomonadaceae bacterium]
MTTTPFEAFDAAAIHEGNKALGFDHDAIAEQTHELLGRMTLAQKINEIRGLQPEPIEGLYYAGGDDELGIAAWKMVDGPRGARTGKATAFPVAIARAASFDVDLERRVGKAIGLETLAKGGNVLLAPCINLLRHPGWGRAQESYSEDTHLTGAMAVAFVSGAQNHVLTSPKHLALNNLENTRFDLTSDVDARTLHELYLPHFKRCVVEAQAASVMSAYNRVNGVYCGEHPELLTDTLRRRWDFKGFVESDWFLGVRSTSESIKAGLNIEMPFGKFFSDKKIAAAIEAGELTDEDIDTAAYWSLYQKVAWSIEEGSVAGDSGSIAVVESDAHLDLAREAARKSFVLLKNSSDVLPIDRRSTRRIAVVGDLADTVNLGDRGSSMVTSTKVITPLAGLQAEAGDCDLRFFATDADFAELGEFDVTIVIAGLTYLDEGEFIPSAQAESDGDDLARGGDRDSLNLPTDQRDLIERAAAASSRCVVVLQGGSAIVVSDWLASVDGLLMSWYGGCQGGAALAQVIFGDADPGGRLPVSIPRSEKDLMEWDTQALAVPHDLLHGYRWLDAHQSTAEFCFGYGLSYSAFELNDLQVQRNGDGFVVTVSVANTGSVRATAVPQLYVSVQNSQVMRVPTELKGFASLELDADETRLVQFQVADEELCFFDEAVDDFRLEAADYVFRAGQNLVELPLLRHWRFDGSAWSETRPG